MGRKGGGRGGLQKALLSTQRRFSEKERERSREEREREVVKAKERKIKNGSGPVVSAKRSQVAKGKGKGREVEEVDNVVKGSEDGVERVDGGGEEELEGEDVHGASEEGKLDVTRKARGVIIPFQDGERILLVGEGNFSYTLSLLQNHLHPSSHHLVTSTAYDSLDQARQKYADLDSNVTQIEKLGAKVMFGVDAGALDKVKEFKKGNGKGKGKGKGKEGVKFDRIVFNFPHIGAGIKDQDRNILTNQKLILRLLQSSRAFLSDRRDASNHGLNLDRKKRRKLDPEFSDVESEVEMEGDEGRSIDGDSEGEGETESSRKRKRKRKPGGGDTKISPPSILITLRNSLPYTLWDVPGLAKRPPPSSTPQPRYKLHRSFAFHPDAYPGYAHRRTKGFKEGLSTSNNEDVLLSARERRGGGGGGGVGVGGAGMKGEVELRTWEFVPI